MEDGGWRRARFGLARTILNPPSSILHPRFERVRVRAAPPSYGGAAGRGTDLVVARRPPRAARCVPRARAVGDIAHPRRLAAPASATGGLRLVGLGSAGGSTCLPHAYLAEVRVVAPNPDRRASVGIVPAGRVGPVPLVATRCCCMSRARRRTSPWHPFRRHLANEHALRDLPRAEPWTAVRSTLDVRAGSLITRAGCSAGPGYGAGYTMAVPEAGVAFGFFADAGKPAENATKRGGCICGWAWTAIPRWIAAGPGQEA